MNWAMLDVGGGLVEDNYSEQWIGLCRTLVEVWWKIIIVNSGLGCVGRWWRFGGR